jgi:hypothetical protein
MCFRSQIRSPWRGPRYWGGFCSRGTLGGHTRGICRAVREYTEGPRALAAGLVIWRSGFRTGYRRNPSSGRCCACVNRINSLRHSRAQEAIVPARVAVCGTRCGCCSTKLGTPQRSTGTKLPPSHGQFLVTLALQCPQIFWFLYALSFRHDTDTCRLHAIMRCNTCVLLSNNFGHSTEVFAIKGLLVPKPTKYIHCGRL